ncbi:MAG TPA: PQQ-binding-like beta-propeller repeat protein [Candidatus Rubrimentiphilum sp.]|nr:PQQ-binding-like beta-propeller repeat protein [Candidatus Rubrimentiphilum sp.]
MNWSRLRRKLHSLAQRGARVALGFGLLFSPIAYVPVQANQPNSTTAAEWPKYQRSPDNNAVVERSNFAAHWTFDAKARVNSALAVVNETVIFDTFDGRVVSLNIATGLPEWEARGDNVMMSTPIVHNGKVYVGTGDKGVLGAKPTKWVYSAHGGQTWGRRAGDHIIAINLATGRQLWSYATVGEDMPSAVIAGGKLVFSNGDQNAYGLEPATGNMIWKTSLGGVSTMASANAFGSLVVFGICTGPTYNGSTVALSPKSGQIIWRSSYGDCDSSPTYANSMIFVSGVDGPSRRYGPGGRGVVAGLDSKSGHVIWVFRASEDGPYTTVGSSERAVAGAFADQIFYQAIPTSDELVAFDGKSGRVRWRLRTAGPVKMSPVITRGRLYVGDTTGVFYTVDSRSGKLLQAEAFDTPFSTSPPVIVGRTIIVAAGTTIHAFPI